MDLNKRIDELIELLVEYLQKTDRLLDRMDNHDLEFSKHEQLFEKQFARMDLAYQVMVTHSEKIVSLQQETKEIYQEILSISKRVKSIEDK